MRRIVLVLLILILAMSILWIFAGRQISMFVDQFKTQVTDVTPTSFLVYQGTGEGGVLWLDNLSLSLAPINPHVGSTKDNQLAIASGGKTFAFASVRFLTDNRLEADVRDNETSFQVKRSYLPWLSFEQRLPPKLIRHGYYEYIFTAKNGQRLSMLWSLDEEKNQTALIRVEISDASRVNR